MWGATTSSAGQNIEALRRPLHVLCAGWTCRNRRFLLMLIQAHTSRGGREVTMPRQPWHSRSALSVLHLLRKSASTSASTSDTASTLRRRVHSRSSTSGGAQTGGNG